MTHQEKVRNLIFSIIIFILIMLLFIIAAEYNESFIKFLTGNVVPELIGIGIELLIIIWVFEKWQSKKQHEKNVVYEKRLREYLIFMLKNIVKELPGNLLIGDFYGKNHLKNKENIKNIISYLNHHENNIELDNLKNIKHSLLIDKTAFENLLEVASLLTDKHFKSWIRIVYFINKLATIHGNNKKEHKVIIQLILRKIIEFDTASNECNIFVGAKEL